MQWRKNLGFFVGLSVVGLSGPVRAESRGDSALATTAPDPGSDAEEHGGATPPFDLSTAVELGKSAPVRVVAQLIEGAPEVSVCTAVFGGASVDPPTSPGVQRALAAILVDGGYRSLSEDYKSIVKDRGGTNEVEVLHDSTIYCTTLPSAEIELGLWIAASRFSASALTAANVKEAIQTLSIQAEQRDAEVHEGRAPVRLRRMAFLGTSSLAHPVLPSPEELEAIDLEAVRIAHHENYVAARSVISIVGGGSRAAAERGIDKYLTRMHGGTAPEVPKYELVTQHTMRFSMDEDRSAKTPAAWYGWVVPEAKLSPAVHAALSILMGEPRLEKSLLQGARPAKRATLHYPFERTAIPTLARIEVVGRFNHSLALVEKELDRQIRALGQSGPTDEELAEYERRLLAEQKAQLITPRSRAFQLSRGMLAGSDPRAILAPLSEEYRPALPTKEAIKSVALSVLAEHQRSVVEIYPKGWQDPWQAPMPLFHIVEKGHTLGSIANRYGTTVDVITKMNGIDSKKPIYPGDKLKVPRGKQKKERPARTHQVRRGETLSGLAVKYGVKVRDIAAANGMGSRQTIRIGETLTIPWPSKSDDKDDDGSASGGSSSSSSGSSDSGRTHKVSSGETLSGIAHKHGVSTVALARENGISHKAMVKIGQTLKLPPPGTGKKEEPPSFITYTVKSGDNLSKIAKKHGVTVAEITVANQMSRKSTIRPGQTLKIPKH